MGVFSSGGGSGMGDRFKRLPPLVTELSTPWTYVTSLSKSVVAGVRVVAAAEAAVGLALVIAWAVILYELPLKAALYLSLPAMDKMAAELLGSAEGRQNVELIAKIAAGMTEEQTKQAQETPDALRMIDKVAQEEGTGEATLDRYGRDIAFFRSLPPTPPEYRNDKALADLMLGEHALGYVGGAGSCSGRCLC